MPATPKALFVTPVFPDTTGNGLAMRAGALLEALAARCSVCLLVIPVYDPDKTTLPESARSFCAQCHIAPISKFDRALARLKNVARQDAELPNASLFTSPRLSRTARQAFEQIHFDYLYVFRLYMTPLAVGHFSRATLKGRYLDLDDIESLTRARLAARYRANKLPAQARREERAAQLFAAYERKYLPKYDGIAVCSRKDKAQISQFIPGDNIHVLPNVVRLPVVSPAPENTTTFNMLFVGNLNYYPNQDALAFFIKDVLPVLRSRVKRRLCFTIIGSGKRRELKRYRSIADCQCVGFVDDLSPYYEQADAVVAPLRAGGGTRIKILEAFSFKRPVITTTLGVEGIDVEHEKHVLIADQPQDFAEQCRRIMENQQLSTTLVNNSFSFLKHNHTLDVLRGRIGKMIV